MVLKYLLFALRGECWMILRDRFDLTTLSGRTGKVRLPRTRKVVGSIPGRGCPNLYCASGAQRVLSCKGWEVTQSFGSTGSYAIISSWLWSTATRS